MLASSKVLYRVSCNSKRCIPQLSKLSAVVGGRSFCVASPTTNCDVEEYKSFLIDVAKIKPPARLDFLLQLLTIKGEKLVNPRDRKGINPFLIPLSMNKVNGTLLCYLRWPTQREEMDLQLVRTTEAGVRLLSTNTDSMCHRIVAEMDYAGSDLVVGLTEQLNRDGKLYSVGDYLHLFQSGKFPISTKKDQRIVLDKYLLTKVGAFPDCYERLAKHALQKGNKTTALIICERSMELFYSWAHPILFYTRMLKGLGREKECQEAAKSAMSLPAWTVAETQADLDEVVKLSGYSGTKIVGDMHAFRSTDPRETEVAEGLNPLQVVLDQASHLMDAVTLGSVADGWSGSARLDLAKKYREGGYPDIADFIETTE